jgi:hypothetical protein
VAALHSKQSFVHTTKRPHTPNTSNPWQRRLSAQVCQVLIGVSGVIDSGYIPLSSTLVLLLSESYVQLPFLHLPPFLRVRSCVACSNCHCSWTWLPTRPRTRPSMHFRLLPGRPSSDGDGTPPSEKGDTTSVPFTPVSSSHRHQITIAPPSSARAQVFSFR